jgi:hypothetical protein
MTRPGPPLPMILFALLLAGCITHGLVGTLLSLPEPDRAAEIVVIREWRFIMGGGDLGVVLDGVLLYGISTDEHVVIKVPPGDHIVGVTARGPGQDEATVTVRAEPRQRYYFRVETGNIHYPVPVSDSGRASGGAHRKDTTSEVKLERPKAGWYGSCSLGKPRV